ncbi:dienelactone hydrolase family protein [Dactylosporangium aurantiacum]|uniref:Dienelactone hydrolase family protein n=1 Tax=Dactylosporangium aurantiacum TaxID=35754 RepID=A0A9Q9IMF7_9ACTN|nr:dienelactone hydrolase family protein [Dactylosporangium aurantiacum]MDG6103124.1 dienelactone hydrolase family protein [Dactylosporangium aurantiacum]UWZ57633.1 dienelactone hydrolase family protein [Dactylosporangium aurantiacum]
MCYEADARPPLLAGPDAGVEAGPVVLESADGTRFAGFLARPGVPAGSGVLVLPDNRGLSGFYEQLATRLAEHGHAALAVDYFGRSAGADPAARGDGWGDMATLMPHLMRLREADLFADLTAATAHLRTAGADAVVSLGFCLGGRFAFLTAAERFGLAGVIGLYGMPGLLLGRPGPTQRAADLVAPVLALFGGGDEGIGPAEVDAFGAALTGHGVPHEIVVYPGAPHGFFDGQLDGFADAQDDAWRRILAFIAARARTPAPRHD